MDKKTKPPATASSLVTAGKIKEEVSELKDAAAVPNEHTDMGPPRRSPVRMVQNFHLVWLDRSIDETTDDDCRNTITKLRQVVNTVNTFINADECIEFIRGHTEAKAFIICSDAFGQKTVPSVHDMRQISSIYIFCENKAHHDQWIQQWPKVKGVFTDITLICEALKQAVQECDQNSISMSFIAPSNGEPTQNLNQLDQSFMYTQILKEILLTIDFEQKHFLDYITYCREQLVGNITELKNVDKLEKEYREHVPIWRYTYHCFLYSMLHRALRTMEVDLIIKMGFFVRDLHEHIARLHSEQYVGLGHSPSFTVFHGQGLSQTDFDQVKNTQGGLLSFNSFLSTSTKRSVSFQFARETITDDLVGILFVMNIDPSIPSTPFANIRDVGYYQEEEDILFSMHSIFRIGKMNLMDNNPRLWQVDLTLTSDNDPQLHALTQRIREETLPDQKDWYRLGNLLIKLGQFNKAQQVFDIVLDQATDKREEGNIYYQLGLIKLNQGEYMEALTFYEKSLKIRQKILSSEHPDVAECYSDIGSVYNKMGDYSKALSSHEKVLEIYRKTRPENHPDLTTSYNNIGLVCKQMGESSKALSYYEKALEIKQKSLPENHPSLATSYNNIGLVYDNMGEYSKALSYHEKALEIYQRTLPPNHPLLATSYHNIGGVYAEMGEYSKALSSHEKALEICQKSLPENHPDLAYSYGHIGMVSSKLEDHSKAISYCERALKIVERSLPASHPYQQLYREALEYVKKKL